MSLPQQIAAAFRSDPTRPLITWYDDATGERIELSVATTCNWVAKTANLLRDTLDVQPGEDVAVALPAHWLTPVVQLAAWLAGARVVALPPDAPVPGVPAAFVTEQSLHNTERSPATQVVALSLRPMAAPLAAPAPPGVLDFAVEAPGHGDDFAPAGGMDGPAAVAGTVELTTADLLDAVARCGLEPGTRAYVRLDPWTTDGLVAGGLAPLLSGAGVVIVGSPDPDRLDARLAAERVTVVLG